MSLQSCKDRAGVGAPFPDREGAGGGCGLGAGGRLIEVKPEAAGVASSPPIQGSFDERWHVLHTKSRQEKTVAEVLDAAGVRCYLPLLKKIAYHGGRRRAVELPLFSSYVFLWGPLEAAYFAIQTKRVVRTIPVPDQKRFDRELGQIRLALEGGAELDPYPYLQRGRHVRVRSGPFQGLEGLVEERLRQDRLILQVQTLGQATSLEIDASLLEIAE